MSHSSLHLNADRYKTSDKWVKSIHGWKTFKPTHVKFEMSVALLPPALRNARGWLLTNVVVENLAMFIFPHVFCWPNSLGLLGGPDQIFPRSLRSSLMC